MRLESFATSPMSPRSDGTKGSNSDSEADCSTICLTMVSPRIGQDTEIPSSASRSVQSTLMMGLRPFGITWMHARLLTTMVGGFQVYDDFGVPMPVILAGRPAITLSRLPGIKNEPISRKRSEELLRRAVAGKRDLSAVRSALVEFSKSAFLLSLRDEGDSESDVDKPEPPIAHQRIPVVLPAQSSCHAHPTSVVDYVGFSLPPSSVLRPDSRLGLPSNTYLASPALAFLLLARKLSRAAALVCALEFCGTYDLASSFRSVTSIEGHRSSGFFSDVRAAMTPQSLRSYLDFLPGRVRGTRVLRSVAGCVAEGSASPMESRLYALLASPTKLGGYGFENVQLNVPIELSLEEARIAGTHSMRIDLVMDRVLGRASNGAGGGSTGQGQRLPRIGIEYDSKSWHEEEADPERIRRDKKRLDIARFHGIEPLPLTWDMVRDLGVFDTFAMNLMQLVGKRRRQLSDKTLSARRKLHRELFSFRSSGL